MFNGHRMPELTAILGALAAQRGTPAVLATLVGVEGSSYRRPGARLLCLADGSRLGSISGGCLEEDLLEQARGVLDSGAARTVTYDTTAENDLVWGVGQGCQGVVRIFLERLPADSPVWVETLRAQLAARRAVPLAVHHGGPAPTGTQLTAALPASVPRAEVFLETIPVPPALVIFGAGDDAQPLAALAKTLGWHITVADARAAYATPSRFPSAAALIVAPAAELAARADPGAGDFAVILTHRYADDLELLRRLLPHPLAYLGLLGPRKRTDRLLAQLRAEGLAPTGEMLAKLHAPVGLDLGGRTPETVALAILAEVQARRSGCAPGFLRDRPGPIHG